MANKPKIFKTIALYFAGFYYGWQKARLSSLKVELAKLRKMLQTGDIPNAFAFSRIQNRVEKLENELTKTKKTINRIKYRWRF